MTDKSASYQYSVAAAQNVQEHQYWTQQLAGELPRSVFPADFPRSAQPQRRMTVENSALSPLAVQLLLKVSQGNDVKLHILLTAGLFLLLQKYAANDDVTIGSPILKQDVQLDFINTILVFRKQIKEESTFKQFLLEVRDTVVNANKNQNYPLQLFIKQWELPVGEDEFPLFDVVLWLENLYDKNFLQGIPYHVGFSFSHQQAVIQQQIYYDASWYQPQTIQQIGRHYARLLEVVLQDMDIPLAAVDMLSPEERVQLVETFNANSTVYPVEKTLSMMVAEAVASFPHHVALIGQSERLQAPDQVSMVTFAQFNEQALALAGHLHQRGCQPGTIVAIICEPSIEMMVGLLGILYAGGAYLPIEPTLPSSRMQFILKDSGANILLTTALIQEQIQVPFAGPIVLFQDFPAWSSDRLPSFSPTNPAYIIYTSGTTGMPKGIITEHSQIVAYLYSFWAEFNPTARDVAIQLTTYTFDLFAEEVFPVLLRGGRIILPNQNDILEIDTLCYFIASCQVTIVDCTPLLLNELNTRCLPHAPKNPLASVHTYISGGDVLKNEYIQNLSATAKVYNTYGPTETTICATYYDYNREKHSGTIGAVIPIGKPIANYFAFIVDKHLHVVPIGVAGELCIGGPGTARGYLNRPQLTHERFIPLSAVSPLALARTDAPSRVYRTGDLTRWLADGNIQFLGRLDFQVKIRGFRIELGDIEAQLLTHPQIAEVFVMAREEANGEKYICAYLVAGVPNAPDLPTLSQLRLYLEERVPDYMIPAYFVWLEKMPLTANGKIDRRALPTPELKTEYLYVAPRNELEYLLVHVWAEILARDLAHAEELQQSIGIDDNFFELGGHSLRATLMAAKIHKECHVKVPLQELFKNPTIRGLAQWITGENKDTHLSIPLAEKMEYYPLSSAQKRLYFLQQLEPTSTSYNMPQVIAIPNELGVPQLESIYNQLIARHESLRTSYFMLDGMPVQKVHERVSLKIERLSCAAAELVKPFELKQPPLLRVAFIQMENQPFMFVDLHHIISDGLSQVILVQDFLALYQHQELAPLVIQYKDYAQWQNQAKESPLIKQHQQYWLKQFAEEIPLLNLPLDFPRPVVQSFEGNSVGIMLQEVETQALVELARQHSATLFMVFLAAFNMLLAKLSNQEDIVIGTPVAGRGHSDLAGIIGMFVNTLALRNYPAAELTVAEFLQQVKTRFLEALENQDYQFEDLVDLLDVQRDISRNPVFDVMFTLESGEQPNALNGAENSPATDLMAIRLPAKFDFSLNVEHQPTQITCTFVYCTRLFKEESIQRYASYLKQILTAMLSNPQQKLSALEYLPWTEKQRLLEEFNQTSQVYPAPFTLHELFAAQVQRTPQRTALVGFSNAEKDVQHMVLLTYAQLNEEANRCMVALQQQGVVPGDIVAVAAHRYVETIVQLLGVLKAGAAYLPIDLEYPEQRVEFILKDSQAKLFLPAAVRFPVAPNQASPAVDPTTLAYIIYTSGSTGKPKGVLIEHKQVVNLVRHQQGFNHFCIEDRILQFSTLCFDASVEQIFTTLTSGAALILVKKETILDAQLFQDYVNQQGVNHLHVVPSFLKTLEPRFFPYLKRILVGGDICPHDLVKQWLPQCSFFNEYGPTETAVTSVAKQVTEVEHPVTIPIGKPLANTTIYLVDKALQLVPCGVSGEMFIGGTGVGRGYLNAPELTHEKFITLFTQRVYRTGDLARWLPDGDIEFLGRIDYQVKIRGFRIELGEIENAILQFPAIQEVVLMAREEKRGEKYLCAYIVPETGWEVLALKEFLASRLPEHMIPTFFVPLDKMPLTSIGKIDRKALPAPQLENENHFVAPRNAVESQLVEIWSSVLAMNPQEISVLHNFFQIGGHSLRATTLMSKIHKEFQVKIELNQIFRTPTIGEIARLIQGKQKEAFLAIEPVEEKEYYPLASAQKRLYFLQQMDPASTSYNMPIVLPLSIHFDVQLLQTTLEKLIARHESLRTAFIRVADETVQRILPQVDFKLEVFDLIHAGADKNLTAQAIVQRFMRPFDLSVAPLLRSGLIQMTPTACLWLVDIHHIISDGSSQTILTEDFFALLKGEVLPSLPLQYKDYSQWQNRLFASGAVVPQEKYWLDVFAGDIPHLQLPVDYERPAIFTFAGGSMAIMLEEQETNAFRALSNHHNATLYMNMMTALNVLLYKYSRQTDIIVGSGIAGRPHIDLLHIVGMFVNSLAMRNFPSGEKSYLSFLNEVTQTSIKAFENQDVQFEELVEKLNLDRDPSRNPLFDVSMVVQNFRAANPTVQGSVEAADISLEALEHATAKFDLTFFIDESDAGLLIGIEYYTGIFSADTVTRLAHHFKNVIAQVVKNPTVTLDEIDILSIAEKEQLLYTFNHTHVDFPGEKSFPQLWAEQVERTPDAQALVYQEQVLTYQELALAAHRLAVYLVCERGICEGLPVGIWMAQSVDRMVAQLAVLEAGGTFVPLDPALPRQRIQFILNDARISMVIAQKSLIRDLNALLWECPSFTSYLCMDSVDVLAEPEQQHNQLMDLELWQHVGETATDEITGGGWLSSYTGLPFSTQEMAEYGDNVLQKLLPLLNPQMKVLEIGCASGITMFRVAPRVLAYYGTDLSATIIEKNLQRIQLEGIPNITLANLAAHEIERITEKDFQLIIINSVIQCFHGFNYLRSVLQKAVDLLADDGYLFIGDVMNLETKNELIRDLITFKEAHCDKGYTTKTDFSAELFVPKAYWQDLQAQWSVVQSVMCSQKLGTLENELTKYRYDVLLKINKRIKPDRRLSGYGLSKRMKFPEDQRAVLAQSLAVKLPGIPAQAPAYIIYTSGSTGKPKGVLVEHCALINLCTWHNTTFAVTAHDRATKYAGFTFDASIWETFPYFLAGASLYLVPEDILLDVAALNQFYEDHRITITFLPTQMSEQFMMQALEYPNRALRIMLTGGDKLRHYVPRGYVLYNNYGPTENTVVTTTYQVHAALANIPIGKPIQNNQVYILAPSLVCVPIGAAGELCVAGDSLARGYLNNPELTQRSFVTYVLPAPLPATGVRLYKTGDLARWLKDGNIEFLGRMDAQVKIRGFRIEPGEIERQLLAHNQVTAAVVIPITDELQDKYLCAYVVVREPSVTSELRSYLARSIPEYMIPSYFMAIEQIPLTPQGKIDRKVLPHPKKKIGSDYIAPLNALEKELVEIWAQVLNIQSHVIGVTTNFFHIGGHSLKATTLVARIHQAFSVKVPLAEVFRLPTIRELAVYISQQKREKFHRLTPAEQREYYPLSSAQRRLYFLYQLAPQSVSYNLPEVLDIGPEPQLEKLATIFQQLIARHESLRSSFHMIQQEPVQKIHERVDFQIEYLQPHESANPFIRPFDLTQAPLVRVGCLRTKDSHLLLIDMHHIISDGVSHQILVNDFNQLYMDQLLTPLALHYKDYAVWQWQQREAPAFKRQAEYWLKEFSGEIPVLQLPLDYPRPAIQVFAGDSVPFTLSSVETQALREIAATGQTTLFMVLLALFNVLLAKLTGQEDIVVGTPIAGRRHTDLEKIIGMFVNTLALRHKPGGDMPFNVFLNEVNARTLHSFENQEYPFEDLVERCMVNRDVSRNPLFDVMFSLINTGENNQQDTPATPPLPAPETNEQLNNPSSAKFDMSLYAMEVGAQLACYFEYGTSLFKAETVQRWVVYFKQIVREIIAHPHLKLAAIDWLPEVEKQQLLEQFNQSSVAFPQDKTIIHLFVEAVSKNPEHLALLASPEESSKNPGLRNGGLTYAALDNQSNRLAVLLQEHGVTNRAIVGLKMERSMDMMIALFAILKAGAAYLPIDPLYPVERIGYLLRDSQAKVLLSNQQDDTFEAVTVIHPAQALVTPIDETPQVSLATPQEPCYVIYTSGSTGNPKGVIIEHRALVNRLWWMQKKYPLTPNDRILQKTTITFDVSVWELFWWSMVGAQLYLLPPGGEKDPARIVATVQHGHVTVMHFVPSMLSLFLEYLDTLPDTSLMASLRQVFASGEALTPHHVSNFKRLLAQPFGTALANLYGPTEATIDVSAFDCAAYVPEQYTTIPIGKPIANISLYILDAYQRLLPVGVAGELCIGGVGVARGYLNRPTLTAEKFIQVCLTPGQPTRLYRTGDLARWLPDGQMDYLGRLDFQVKVRGFRIELGEIEACLQQHEEVKEVVVLANEDKNRGTGEKILCAYIVARHEIAENVWRDYLNRFLPAHMVPAVFKQVEQIPLTPSGKVDRLVLAASAGRSISRAQYLEPSSALEQQLMRMWLAVLPPRQTPLGVLDNFFDIGGSSMDVMRLSMLMTQELQREVPIVMFYKYTHIRALAQWLEQGETGPTPESQTAQTERSERLEKGRLDRNKMRDLRKKSDRR